MLKLFNSPEPLKVPCITELGPELMLECGVLELGEPDQFSTEAVFNAVRKYQAPGTCDYLDTIQRYLETEDDRKGLDALNALVDVGANAIGGSEVIVDVTEFGETNPDGKKVGTHPHVDADRFALTLAEHVGTLAMIDPENPSRLLVDEWHEIEDRLKYVFQFRPNVATLMRRELLHMGPDLKTSRLRRKPQRRAISIQYSQGQWPTNLTSV